MPNLQRSQMQFEDVKHFLWNFFAIFKKKNRDHMAAEHCEEFLKCCLLMPPEQLEQLKSFSMYVD
jgi:hypothetical protein